jgi:dTMP kinase
MKSIIDQDLLNHFKPKSYDNTFLLSFEGIEGSGKSTQIKKLTQKLQKSDYEVSYFREPGGTKFGEKLRSAILESDSPIDPLAEANLFAASRAQLLSQIVLPILQKPNQVVILDRYIDSSLAYQGEARGLGAECILDLHKRAPLNTTAHCTFYLKIDTETSLTRQSARGDEKDYFEKENIEFYQSLISGFDSAANLFKERIQVIDGSLDEERVSAMILQSIKNKTSIKL